MAGDLLKKLLFVFSFALLALLADQLKVFTLWGAPGQFFTAFQFFGPIAGAFIGTTLGVAAVLIAEIAAFLFAGKEASLLNLLRLLPMLFAAFYFAYKGDSRVKALVPVVAILLFLLHPVGREAFYFAGFWLIPIAASLYFKDNLLAKSLGATFTAHAVGGVVWIYLMPTTAAFWTVLIPVVAVERLVFTAGIYVSFVAVNTLLSRFENKLPKGVVEIRKFNFLFSLKG